VHRAVAATRSAIGRNTNLGMILLFAPLAAVSDSTPLRDGVREVLAELTVEDAREVFAAIRLAQPGGLGVVAQEDVHAEPTVTLLEAMTLAAERDQIAQEYVNGFATVFDFGVPRLLESLAEFGCLEAAIIDLQLRWLAAYPDSLVARKNGPAVAEEVRWQASHVLQSGGLATPAGRQAGAAFNRFLRRDGNKLNPGTTADLIAACLFAALRENRIVTTTRFEWPVSDWL
jgi:triphosphoribosyl-dephospho-CoA synthase